MVTGGLLQLEWTFLECLFPLEYVDTEDSQVDIVLVPRLRSLRPANLFSFINQGFVIVSKELTVAYKT